MAIDPFIQMLRTIPFVALECFVHRVNICFPALFPGMEPLQGSHIENIDVPLCIDCVHFITDGRADLGRCSVYGKRNPVTGKITHSYAELVRQNETECGPKGKNFIQSW